MTDTEQHWRGIGKLTDECGEVLQLLGKAMAFPVGAHPDGLQTGPIARPTKSRHRSSGVRPKSLFGNVFKINQGE